MTIPALILENIKLSLGLTSRKISRVLSCAFVSLSDNFAPGDLSQVDVFVLRVNLHF